MAVPRPRPHVTQVSPPVGRVGAGGGRAFEQLVRVTAADTYALAHRLVGDEGDARDVVQEVYLRASRAVARSGGGVPSATWLRRTTANAAAAHLGRRRRPEPLIHDEEAVDLAPGRGPGAVSEAARLRGRLTAELADLPPRLRAVVVLCDVYGVPRAEVAAELGVSGRAVEARLRRGRRRLRERLLRLPGEGAGRSLRCADPTGARSAVAGGDAVRGRGSRHVTSCIRCQAELVQHRRLRRALHGIRGDVAPAPPHLVADVLAAVAGPGHERPSRPLGTGRRPVRLGSVAVATAAAGVAVVRRQRGRRTTG